MSHTCLSRYGDETVKHIREHSAHAPCIAGYRVSLHHALLRGAENWKEDSGQDRKCGADMMMLLGAFVVGGLAGIVLMCCLFIARESEG